MKNKLFLISIVITLIFSSNLTSLAKPKLSSVCKEGIKTCILLDQGSQTVSEALQACIHCCSEDIKRIIGKPCFNSCTNKCSIKFTGKPIKRTTE